MRVSDGEAALTVAIAPAARMSIAIRVKPKVEVVGMFQPLLLRWRGQSCPPSFNGSGEQILDDLSSADDIDRPSTRREQLLLGIDAQAVEDRGAHVFDTQR